LIIFARTNVADTNMLENEKNCSRVKEKTAEKLSGKKFV